MRNASLRKGEASKTIKGYKFLDIAGKGAYGQVYLAEKDSNTYAIKEILMDSLDDENNSMHQEDYDDSDNDKNDKNKIMKEVLILKYLEHPNII